MAPLYEITVAGEDATVVTVEALMDAWAENAPEGVARALDLGVDDVATVCDEPRVRVRRLR